jgi:hypothetical protein
MNGSSRRHPINSPSAKAFSLVLRSRGPPRRGDLRDKKDREASPVFRHIRALQRGNKS